MPWWQPLTSTPWAQMRQFRRGRKLATITIGPNLTQMAVRSGGAGRSREVDSSALARRTPVESGQPGLARAAQQFGLSPGPFTRTELQRIIKKANGSLDIVQWRTRLAELEGRVCRIEIPMSQGTAYGTGFVVGPDCLAKNDGLRITTP